MSVNTKYKNSGKKNNENEKKFALLLEITMRLSVWSLIIRGFETAYGKT